MIELGTFSLGSLGFRFRADRWVRLPFVLTPRIPHGPFTVRYAIRARGRSKVVARDGRAIYVGRALGDVVDALEGDVYTVLERLSSMSPLHAACVTTDAGAFLLVGPSGAGKSTLTRELVRRGVGRYAGDEHVFVGPGQDAHGGEAAAVPRRLRLSPDRTLRWNNLGTHRAVVQKVVFLEIPRRSLDRLSPISAAEGALRLVGALQRRPAEKDLHALVRLAGSVPLARLACGGISDAADQLARWMTS